LKNNIKHDILCVSKVNKTFGIISEVFIVPLELVNIIYYQGGKKIMKKMIKLEWKENGKKMPQISVSREQFNDLMTTMVMGFENNKISSRLLEASEKGLYLMKTDKDECEKTGKLVIRMCFENAPQQEIVIDENNPAMKNIMLGYFDKRNEISPKITFKWMEKEQEKSKNIDREKILSVLDSFWRGTSAEITDKDMKVMKYFRYAEEFFINKDKVRGEGTNEIELKFYFKEGDTRCIFLNKKYNCTILSLIVGYCY